MDLKEFVRDNKDIFNAPDFFEHCLDYLDNSDLADYDKATAIFLAALLKEEPIYYEPLGTGEYDIIIRDNSIWTMQDDSLMTEEDLADALVEELRLPNKNTNDYSKRIRRLLREA